MNFLLGVFLWEFESPSTDNESGRYYDVATFSINATSKSLAFQRVRKYCRLLADEELVPNSIGLDGDEISVSERAKGRMRPLRDLDMIIIHRSGTHKEHDTSSYTLVQNKFCPTNPTDLAPKHPPNDHYSPAGLQAFRLGL